MLNSYLGGTAKNLAALFDFVNKQQCVVMLDELDSLAVKRKYGEGGADAEISRSTTCLLQFLDTVTNDHVILAATNLPEDVDDAVKRRFTEKHKMLRLTSEENEAFIRQFLDDTGFSYSPDSVKNYAVKNHSQAEIMTHMVRSIADALIYGRSNVVL